MKAYTAITLGLAIAASTALSQVSIRQTVDERPYLSKSMNYGTAKLSQAKKNLLWTLKSDNDGVVESAIGQIAHMRVMVPLEDITDIEVALAQLANYGRTPAIRYKAYLATMVFANPGMFRQDVTKDYASSDEFLSAVASRLQQTVLGYSAQ